VQRRFLLKSLFGTAGALAAAKAYPALPDFFRDHGEDLGLCRAPRQRQSDSRPSHTPPRLNVIDTYLEDIFRQRQFTLFGDSDHSSLSVQTFLWHPHRLDMMARSGIKHVGIEYDRGHQPYLDRIASGELSGEEYASLFRRTYLTRENNRVYSILLARGVRQLAENGVKVHCIDTSRSDFEIGGRASLDFRAQASVLGQEMCAASGGKPRISMRRLYGLMEPRLGIRFMREYPVFKGLREDDRDRTRIMEELCGGEKGIIFFGNKHMGAHPTSFASLLNDRATVINLYDDRARFYPDRHSHIDYAYFMQENRFEGVRTELPIATAGATLPANSL
jgi:hypothetical protein